VELMMERKNGVIRDHRDLDVYKMAFEAAMVVFSLSKEFPPEERYALTDQIRRSSRSVCGNLAEAWRKRRYQAAFVAKLNDAEAEAAETQTWLDFAAACDYLNSSARADLRTTYNNVIGKLVIMIQNPTPWIVR
jgi:four helix bundle protein